MSLRPFLILAAVAMALLFATPVTAAPLAQERVDEVVVTSATAFTLTVRIDEVTTVAIPLQVDWRAEGPTAGADDEVTVVISPTVLRTGFFSVTVGSVEPAVGTLSITFAAPEEESVAITQTSAITGTTSATSTLPVDTAPPTTAVPAGDAPTTNAVSNLRSGPGTEYPIVGSANAGDALDIVGQNSDGTWLALANSTWIATFLVNNVPADLPVVVPSAPPPTTDTTTPDGTAPDTSTPDTTIPDTSTSEAEPTPSPNILIPTPTPVAPPVIAPTAAPQSEPVATPAP